ncbi:MAG: S8 family serine peptidase [Actinomycetota bacterium]|nr:S8 family serine peptidase [Actinomycetota bacterium]
MPNHPSVPSLNTAAKAACAALALGAALLIGSPAAAHVGRASTPVRATLTRPPGPPAPAEPDPTGRDAVTGPAYVPHEVLVGYAPGPAMVAAATIERRMGVRAVAGAGLAPRSRLLRLGRGESVPSAIERLRRKPGIAYVKPNYIAHSAGAFFPNDPGRQGRTQGWERLQWNLLPITGVDAPEAWANLLGVGRPGGRGVTVAVLDTGVAYRDWKQFHQSPDFGRTRFVSPYDFVSNNAYPLDRNGHGTFVAGVVAESTNNGVALTGLAYGASVMPVRILDASGLGDEATIAKGIRYAVAHHAQIINLSLEFLPNEVTSASDIPEIVSAINFAHARGVMVVGAAGNDQSRQIAYPARAHGVVSVGATTKDVCLADYSNNGSSLSLVAPGGGSDAIMPSNPFCHPDRNLPSIYQLTLTSVPHWARFGYPSYYIGTSMSAPEVSATAALVIASGVIGPHPSPAQLLTRLEQTATPLGGSRPNPAYGYGIINAGNATSRHPVISPSTSPSSRPALP